MSDTAWISLAVIVAAVGVVGIMVLLRNKPDALLAVKTNWGQFTFSPTDARRIIRELYGPLNDRALGALSAFNTSGGKPTQRELDSIDDDTLDAIVAVKLVQDP